METGGIAFSSLLIGLLAGVQPVSVAVAPTLGAKVVVFAIDGREDGWASGPEWETVLGFGEALEPHVVTATAYDESGRTVGVATRRVNVPQAPARLEILLENEPATGRPVAARLLATSVRGDRPARRRLRLDGEELELDPNGRAVLPPRNLSMPHVLSGSADYGDDAIARAEVAYGGDVTETSGSRLTAVPIRLAGASAPTLEDLRGVFRSPLGSVPAVAIEKGGATILFVREPLNGEALRRLGAPNAFGDYRIPFEAGDDVGLIWPVARSVGSVRAELFELVGPFDEYDRGYHWLLAEMARVGGRSEPPYRFADAVAVAGLQASGAGMRRAVVLIEGAERRDASRFSDAQVRGYLERLGVPLKVWSLTGTASRGWAGVDAEDVSSFVGLSNAVRRLKDDLARQRMVWIAGDWPPGAIRCASEARGFELLH